MLLRLNKIFVRFRVLLVQYLAGFEVLVHLLDVVSDRGRKGLHLVQDFLLLHDEHVYVIGCVLRSRPFGLLFLFRRDIDLDQRFLLLVIVYYLGLQPLPELLLALLRLLEKLALLHGLLHQRLLVLSCGLEQFCLLFQQNVQLLAALPQLCGVLLQELVVCQKFFWECLL